MTYGRRACLRTASVAVAVMLGPAYLLAAENPSPAAVKAAFIFNFAKFTEWPGLASDAPIVVCVEAAAVIASELTSIARGATVGRRAVVVSTRGKDNLWDGCHVLFVEEGTMGRFAALAPKLRTKPVLTISDSQGFSKTVGIIELYLDGGRMHFAINVDAVDRAGLRLSSHLLGLARVVRDDE